METLGLAIAMAKRVIGETIDKYIGMSFNMEVEAHVHQEVNMNLAKLNDEYVFTAQTVFDYDTLDFVTTLSVKPGKSGPKMEKPVVVNLRQCHTIKSRFTVNNFVV